MNCKINWEHEMKGIRSILFMGLRAKLYFKMTNFYQLLDEFTSKLRRLTMKPTLLIILPNTYLII